MSERTKLGRGPSLICILGNQYAKESLGELLYSIPPQSQALHCIKRNDCDVIWVLKVRLSSASILGTRQ